jgi:hypothetical protein
MENSTLATRTNMEVLMQSIQRHTLIFGSALLFILGGCGDDAEENKQPDAAGTDAGTDADTYPRQGMVLVDHYKTPCVGEAPQLCLRVTELDETTYENFYDDIVGFDYQWGHRYELQVEASRIEDPPQDGPWLRYELIEVASDQFVGEDEHFQIELSSDYVSGDPASGTFRLLDERDVTCAEQSVCDAIDAAIDAGNPILVELGHPADPGEALIAHSTP